MGVARHKSTGDMLTAKDQWKDEEDADADADDVQSHTNRQTRKKREKFHCSSGQLTNSNTCYIQVSQEEEDVCAKGGHPLDFPGANCDLINRWNSCGRLLASRGREQSFWWDEKDTQIVGVEHFDDKLAKKKKRNKSIVELSKKLEQEEQSSHLGIPHVVLVRHHRNKEHFSRWPSDEGKQQQQQRTKSSPLLLPFSEIETAKKRRPRRTSLAKTTTATSTGKIKARSGRTSKASQVGAEEKPCELLSYYRNKGDDADHDVHGVQRSKSKSMFLPLKVDFVSSSSSPGNNLSGLQAGCDSTTAGDEKIRRPSVGSWRRAADVDDDGQAQATSEYDAELAGAEELRLPASDEPDDSDEADQTDGQNAGELAWKASLGATTTAGQAEKTMSRLSDNVHLLQAQPHAREAEQVVVEITGHERRPAAAAAAPAARGGELSGQSPKRLDGHCQAGNFEPNVAPSQQLEARNVPTDLGEPEKQQQNGDRLCPHRRTSPSSSSSLSLSISQDNSTTFVAPNGQVDLRVATSRTVGPNESQYLHHIDENQQQEEFRLHQPVVVDANEQQQHHRRVEMVDLVGAKSRLTGACQQVANSLKFQVCQMPTHSGIYKVAATTAATASQTNQTRARIITQNIADSNSFVFCVNSKPTASKQVAERAQSEVQGAPAGPEVTASALSATNNNRRRISSLRLSRPGRSPVSLQRQTNARLARHRAKIQQQRQEQLAQLAQRERQQLVALSAAAAAAANHNNSYFRRQQSTNTTSFISTISGGQTTSNANYNNNNNHIGSSQQIETLEDITRERQDHQDRRRAGRSSRLLAGVTNWLAPLARFINTNQFLAANNNDSNVTSSDHHTQRVALADYGRLNEVVIANNSAGGWRATGGRHHAGPKTGDMMHNGGSSRGRPFQTSPPTMAVDASTASSDLDDHQMDDTRTICSTTSDHSATSSTSSNSYNKPFCKICHLGNNTSNSDYNLIGGHLKNGQHDKLISPCKCSGTMQYIHCGCLLKWLEISNRTSEKPMSCELCSHEYTWHKKFNYSQLRLPKCSYKDMFLHLIFVLAISMMIFCALAPMFGRHKFVDSSDNQSTSSSSSSAALQNIRSSHSISFGDANQPQSAPPPSGRDPNHLSSSSSYRRTFAGYSGSQLAPGAGRLGSDEKFILSCAAFFFVAFFMAIYVQTKSRDTLYGLIVKFMDINQTYYITEYDHGAGANGPPGPASQTNNGGLDKLANNNDQSANDSNLINNRESASSDINSDHGGGGGGRCLARLERSQGNGRKAYNQAHHHRNDHQQHRALIAHDDHHHHQSHSQQQQRCLTENIRTDKRNNIITPKKS